MKVFTAGKYTKDQIKAIQEELADVKNMTVDKYWNRAMEIRSKELMKSDKVLMPLNWQNCEGARIEHKKAIEWGIEIKYL